MTGPSGAPSGRYHRHVLGLIMVVVLVVVWIRRRLMIRTERRSQAEQAANAEREREIIARMEEDFQRG
jgi:C4-dicarboxylate-specific signal transduction histidine kinase